MHGFSEIATGRPRKAFVPSAYRGRRRSTVFRFKGMQSHAASGSAHPDAPRFVVIDSVSTSARLSHPPTARASDPPGPSTRPLPFAGTARQESAFDSAVALRERTRDKTAADCGKLAHSRGGSSSREQRLPERGPPARLDPTSPRNDGAIPGAEHNAFTRADAQEPHPYRPRNEAGRVHVPDFPRVADRRPRERLQERVRLISAIVADRTVEPAHRERKRRHKHDDCSPGAGVIERRPSALPRRPRCVRAR